MQICKYVITLFIFVLSTLPVHAHEPIFTSVPFQNIILNPGQTINSSFAFGANPIIFCYENNQQSIGVVTWPYKGRIYSSTLSVSLVTNGQYQGNFADPSGNISVTNNQNYQLVVNCVYGF
jgi:hypothetical protein